METGAAFLTQSREYLTAHYLPKIQAALEALDESDLWWRPNPASNAIGNLMLHLSGNIRQWIVGGVGKRANQRDRPAEFAATGGRSRGTSYRFQITITPRGSLRTPTHQFFGSEPSTAVCANRI